MAGNSSLTDHQKYINNNNSNEINSDNHPPSFVIKEKGPITNIEEPFTRLEIDKEKEELLHFAAKENMASSKLEQKPSLLSPDDVDKLYHHFLRIDQDGNGVIDRDELMNLPAVTGNPLAGRLLELFDTDKSGDINFGEFVAGLAIFSAKSNTREKLKFAFDLYDLDQDGFISNGELFLVIKLMSGDHLKPVQLQQIVDKTIRDADTDGDGRLSFDEFCKIVERKNTDFVHKWSVSDL